MGVVIETLATSRKTNPNLSLLGFVVTMFDDRLRSHKDGVSQLREGYKDRVFKATVRMDARVREAPSHRQGVVTYSPEARAAQDYKAVAREFLARTEKARAGTKSRSQARRTARVGQ